MAKILVVDDSKLMVSALKKGLEDFGHEVLTASSAREGYDVAITAMPDLVTLDFEMPEGPGTGMLQRMREHQMLSVVPVVFVSSVPREKLGEELFSDEHLVRFLPKPPDMKALSVIVDEMVLPRRKSAFDQKPPA